MSCNSIENRPVDVRIYQEELCSWLPERIIDGHVHIGIKEHCAPISAERLKGNWATEVGADESWQRYADAVKTLFPRQEVSALAMGVPMREMDSDANNEYVLRGAVENDARALLVTRPDWAPEKIEAALKNGFVGLKPYPDLAPTDSKGPRIFDFLPEEHLEVLNRHAGILLLHLPRAGRIADPDNIRELRDLSRRYPKVRTIVAHIGRAFCLPTALAGLPSLADCSNLWFDTAANLNADVFAFAIELLGPERLIYGSDLPITLMRGIREHVGEQYINYTDGCYSWNKVRKPPDIEANYTYFIYEELRALIAAVKRVGLGKKTLARIMYSNLAGLINSDSPGSNI